MNDSKKILVTILKLVTDKIASLNPADYAALLDGSKRIVINMEDTRKSHTKRTNEQEISPKLEEILGELKICDNREAGTAILRNRITTKDQLTRIAKMIDLPLTREDSREKLEEKIIEATIGFRLRSKAIQGS